MISHAIRTGVSDRSQCFGRFFGVNQCYALGAVAISIGVSKLEKVLDRIKVEYPQINNTSKELTGPLLDAVTKMSSPSELLASSHKEYSLLEAVIYANDYARIPINDIADLVEKGEKAFLDSQKVRSAKVC